MDTNVLVNEAAQHINAASAAISRGVHLEAKEHLIHLCDLLNTKLPIEAPAEPETPKQDGQT